MARWERALTRVAERGASPSVVAHLRASPIPEAATAAVSSAVAETVGAGLSGAAQQAALAAALGLSSDAPGAALGRLLTPDGALSWTGEALAASRTAATSDFGQEMIELGRAEGYTHKRWITREDVRVRDAHRAMDGVTVPLDEDFIMEGFGLRFPADPLCPELSLVVNCRCVLVLVDPGLTPMDAPAGTAPWNEPYRPSLR